MLDLSRRVVIISLGMAAAAGLALPAVVSSAGEPDLIQPVQVTRTDDGSAGTPSIPTDPMPVRPSVQGRDDNARSNVDDEDDQPVADDDADGGDDGPDRTTNRRTDDGGGGFGGGGTDDGAGGNDSADSASGD